MLPTNPLWNVTLAAIGLSIAFSALSRPAERYIKKNHGYYQEVFDKQSRLYSNYKRARNPKQNNDICYDKLVLRKDPVLFAHEAEIHAEIASPRQDPKRQIRLQSLLHRHEKTLEKLSGEALSSCTLIDARSNLPDDSKLQTATYFVLPPKDVSFLWGKLLVLKARESYSMGLIDQAQSEFESIFQFGIDLSRADDLHQAIEGLALIDDAMKGFDWLITYSNSSLLQPKYLKRISAFLTTHYPLIPSSKKLWEAQHAFALSDAAFQGYFYSPNVFKRIWNKVLRSPQARAWTQKNIHEYYRIAQRTSQSALLTESSHSIGINSAKMASKHALGLAPSKFTKYHASLFNTLDWERRLLAHSLILYRAIQMKNRDWASQAPTWLNWQKSLMFTVRTSTQLHAAAPFPESACEVKFSSRYYTPLFSMYVANAQCEKR